MSQANLGGSVGCGLTGDQEVVVSTTARLATFFLGDLLMKYFPW